MSFQNEAAYLGKRVNLLEEQNRILLEACEAVRDSWQVGNLLQMSEAVTKAKKAIAVVAVKTEQGGDR